MKKTAFLLLLAITVLFSSPSFADECMSGDCENGTGTGFTEEGKIYSGEWKDGEPHGTGKLTVSKGKFIERKWNKGILVEEKKK